MTVLDKDFPKKVQPGDFVVGGEGTGYGHDHDSRLYFPQRGRRGSGDLRSEQQQLQRNSIHHGLPVVEVKGIMAANKNGDELEVDLAEGKVKAESENSKICE